MTLSRLHRKAKLQHGAITEIAEETGYDLSYVSLVVNGRRRNEEIEQAAARKMGVPVEKAFPPRKTRAVA